MIRSRRRLARALAFVVVVVGVVVGALALLAPAPALALATPTVGAPAPSPPPSAPGDDEAPDSPRASLRAFFDLCERGRYEEASRYLDVPRGAERRTAELARKLHVVLAERLWVDPEQLSPRPDGRRQDGSPGEAGELGRIRDAKGRAVAVRIVRHESRSPEDEARWVFAQSTVQAVDALYATLRGQWLRVRMPSALQVQGPFALYWWQWFAMPVLAGLCLLLGRVLTWLSGLIARRLTSRVAWASRLLGPLKGPATLAWALVAFSTTLPFLALTLRAEDLVERLLSALGWLAFFWALLRAVTVAGDQIADARWARSRPSARSLASVSVRLGKVVVAALALMVALSELGYPVTSIVAGLGIGGVALALAAQKTVENLFGSVSILVDQPFRVGDVIRVDSVEGTVESIGLRSTRMRTVDRTLIVIPNGKLADMRIETLGARDRIRFATKLQLARTSSSAEIARVIELARACLEAHERVVRADVFVRMTGVTDTSVDVDVAAPIETLDPAEFAAAREQLLLGLVDVVGKAGARLAEPRR